MMGLGQEQSVLELLNKGRISQETKERFQELSQYLILGLVKNPDSLPFEELLELIFREYGLDKLKKLMKLAMSRPTIAEVYRKNTSFWRGQDGCKDKIRLSKINNYRQVTVNVRSRLNHNSGRKTKISSNNESETGGDDSGSDEEITFGNLKIDKGRGSFNRARPFLFDNVYHIREVLPSVLEEIWKKSRAPFLFDRSVFEGDNGQAIQQGARLFYFSAPAGSR